MTDLIIQFPTGSSAKETGAFNYPAGDVKVAPTKFTLAGVPVALSGSFSWGYQAGVSPQMATIKMASNYVDELVRQVDKGQGQIDIKISSNGENNRAIPLEFKGLSFLPRSPSSHTHDLVTVTDDRWRWPNMNVYSTYNLVRKVNDVHVFGRGKTSSPTDASLFESAKFYVPWTIRDDGRPWTAIDIVRDVLENVLGYDAKDINTEEATESKYIPPNIVLEGAKAHSVLSRFLGESNNNLYIDEKGKIHIYAERIPFGQDEFDKFLAPALHGKVSGDMWVQDRESIRPTNIFCSLAKEYEILLTYRESDSRASVSGGRPAVTKLQAIKQLNSGTVYIENVTETVVDKQVGNAPRGTIVTIEDALEAFGQEYGSEGVSLDKFRKFYGIDGTSVFANVLTEPNTASTLDGRAIVMWNKIVRDYRKRFRIPPAVTQYLKSAKNVLVEIVSEESGKRRPSEVFSKISWVVRTEARLLRKRSQGITLDSFANLRDRQDYSPVPLTVSSIDLELGTFEIGGLTDLNHPAGMTSMILGRPVDGDAFFEDQFAEGETSLSRNALAGAHGLDPDWEMSTVISVINLPRDVSTMKWFDVPPPEGMEAGEGPLVEIHLRYDTARFALRGSGTGRYQLGEGAEFTNQQLCNAIALAEGQRRWPTFSDQLVGNVQSSLSLKSTKFRPIGPISNVKFTITSNGNVRFGVSAAPISEGRDIRNTLEAEQLEVIFKQLHLEETKGTR